ncbi:MAG: copper amine oxidase N-terminal domain-containing protein [Clostridia bacterium]|nr:copper amine oxidase N-terminal domain-containing protein [Clostridia bacterium]
MKKRLQGLVVGVLIGTILASGAVFAKQTSKKAELFYNNIKIKLNGQEVKPKDANGNYVEPFIIDGTTYLPVRAVANALGISVNWDGNTNSVLLSNQSAESVATGFDASKVASELKVIKEYRWEGYSTDYLAIILKNESAYTVSPRVQISFKDKNGAVVGAENKTEYAFGPGSEMAFIFSNDEAFDSYEYIISANEEKYYSECVSDLECTYSTTSDKVIIQVKNNGDKAAHFVEYTTLFKKDGKVIDYDWGYCTDDDSEIKPSMTEIDESSIGYGKNFDTVEIYFTGRADKN